MHSEFLGYWLATSKCSSSNIYGALSLFWYGLQLPHSSILAMDVTFGGENKILNLTTSLLNFGDFLPWWKCNNFRHFCSRLCLFLLPIHLIFKRFLAYILFLFIKLTWMKNLLQIYLLILFVYAYIKIVSYNIINLKIITHEH